MDRLNLYFSDVRLELEGDVPQVLDALGVVWALARTPIMEPRREHRMAVVTAGASIEVHVDGVVLESTDDPAHGLVLAERALYHQIHTWHARELLLHASCFYIDGRVCLLLGASGSGKSGLCREATTVGARYMSDELAVTDGKQLWGIPRAIQFDAIDVGAPVPDWLAGTDLQTYRLRNPQGVAQVVPLVPTASTPMDPAARPAADVCVFELARDDRDQLEPIRSLEALAAVHAAALSRVRLDLGALVGAGRCWRLTWATPDGGLQALRSAIRGC